MGSLGAPGAVPTVHELVDACLRGDELAASRFVSRYQARVFALCFRMVAHRQDAEDMAQETFTRALKSLHRWDPSREMEPWLMAIAANRCRTLLRKRSRRPLPTDQVDHVADGRPAEFAGAQLAEEIELALEGLRPEYRQAFCLFHEQQMSYDEIAQVCGRPLGTVKTWIHRARKEVVQQLLKRGVVEETRHAVRADSQSSQ